MKAFVDFITENYDRASIGQLYRNYDPKATMGDGAWTGERVRELSGVIQSAKQKLEQIINSNPKIKSEWPIVKQWLDKNKYTLLRFSHKLPDTVLIDAGNGATVEMAPNNRLKVSSEMKSIIEWRFVILDAERIFNDHSPPLKYQLQQALQHLGQFLHT